MQNNGYVQTYCPSCRNPAWGHPLQQVACSACGQMVPAMAAPPGPFAAAPPQQAYVAPAPVAVAPTPAASPNVVKIQLPYGIKLPVNIARFGKFGILGVVLVVILGSVGFAIWKMKKKGNATAKGNLSYSSIGLDMNKADPDAMITAVATQATKWRKDAVWWSINLQAVNADGTVDLSNGGAQVEYISVAGVQDENDKAREDSVKEFVFGPAGVDYSRIVGATEPWKGVTSGPKVGACQIKDVVKLLDLPAGKTVRITFDPQFASHEAWHVLGDDPKIDAHYAMADCAVIP